MDLGVVFGIIVWALLIWIIYRVATKADSSEERQWPEDDPMEVFTYTPEARYEYYRRMLEKATNPDAKAYYRAAAKEVLEQEIKRGEPGRWRRPITTADDPARQEYDYGEADEAPPPTTP